MQKTIISFTGVESTITELVESLFRACKSEPQFILLLAHFPNSIESVLNESKKASPKNSLGEFRIVIPPTILESIYGTVSAEAKKYWQNDATTNLKIVNFYSAYFPFDAEKNFPLRKINGAACKNLQDLMKNLPPASALPYNIFTKNRRVSDED